MRPQWWTDAASTVIEKGKRKLNIKADESQGLDSTEAGLVLLRAKLVTASGLGEFYLLAEDCRKLLEWKE